MNIKIKFDEIIKTNTRAVPLAYYPSRKLINATMNEILSDSNIGARCLIEMKDTFKPAMLIRMTELWAEAEAFGARVEIRNNSFPRIRNKIIDIEDISQIEVPNLKTGRLPILIESIEKTRTQLPDALIFAGIAGTFSLGNTLTDAEDLMVACYTDPELVHAYLEKISTFIIDYCEEYKSVGASGVIIAEPSICMLSPSMAQEFSHNYIKTIITQVQSDHFAIIYHNSGDVSPQLESIRDLKAMAYHFGNAVSMQNVLEIFPQDIPILGNIHPAKFTNGNEQGLIEDIRSVRKQFSSFSNFVLSSGYNIAPSASLESISLMFNNE